MNKCKCKDSKIKKRTVKGYVFYRCESCDRLLRSEKKVKEETET